MIDPRYWPTPNCKKVAILPEECGLAYRLVPCNIGPHAAATDNLVCSERHSLRVAAVLPGADSDAAPVLL